MPHPNWLSLPLVKTTTPLRCSFPSLVGPGIPMQLRPDLCCAIYGVAPTHKLNTKQTQRSNCGSQQSAVETITVNTFFLCRNLTDGAKPARQGEGPQSANIFAGSRFLFAFPNLYRIVSFPGVAPRDLEPPVAVRTLRQGGWLNAVEPGNKDSGVVPSKTGTGVSCLCVCMLRAHGVYELPRCLFQSSHLCLMWPAAVQHCRPPAAFRPPGMSQSSPAQRK